MAGEERAIISLQKKKADEACSSA